MVKHIVLFTLFLVMVFVFWNKTDDLEEAEEWLIDLQTMVHERMDVMFYPKQLMHITSDHHSKVIVNHMAPNSLFEKGTILFKILVSTNKINNMEYLKIKIRYGLLVAFVNMS